MPNPFDTLDAPPVASAAPAQNPFDQLDKVNPFDSLDAPPAQEVDRTRLIAQPAKPDFIIDPQTHERLMTPPASFWQQIAGAPSPVSHPAQIPPEVAARVASVTPPLPAPQPVIGPLVQNIPQPSVQQRLMTKVGTGAGYDYLTKPLWDYLPEQLRSQLDAGQLRCHNA